MLRERAIRQYQSQAGEVGYQEAADNNIGGPACPPIIFDFSTTSTFLCSQPLGMIVASCSRACGDAEPRRNGVWKEALAADANRGGPPRTGLVSSGVASAGWMSPASMAVLTRGIAGVGGLGDQFQPRHEGVRQAASRAGIFPARRESN